MIFLHKFPEINLSPYAHTSGNVCGDCPCHNMPRVSLWSSVDLQIRGARLCIYHPHAQGVLLTHFGSCLEAVDSESQIRCHNISTRVSRDQSQPICTQTWYVFCQCVLLTHFVSCLEAAISESQIRCQDISTRVSRDQSQPICTQTWYVFCRDCPYHNMPRDSIWSSVNLQIRGARLCICHPRFQGVLLTHFVSYLEAADSESQIRCQDISTQVFRHSSQPICTHTWDVFFRDCPCHNMPIDSLWSSVDLQIRGTRFVYMPSTLSGRATYAFW